MLARPPAVDFVRDDTGRIDAVAEVTVRGDGGIEAVRVVTLYDPVRAAHDPQALPKQRALLNHLAGSAVNVHRLTGCSSCAIDLASGLDGQNEHEQREARRPLGLPGLLRDLFVDHLDYPVAG